MKQLVEKIRSAASLFVDCEEVKLRYMKLSTDIDGNFVENYQYNDGGRKEAGFKGHTGDCVARAIAIASGRPYREVYDRLAEGNKNQRVTRRTRARNARVKTARLGIYVKRKWFKDYMAELGFEWTPTMQVGQGCKVHLDASELPSGRLVVAVSKHYTAMIDGVINDTYDPRRYEVGAKNGVHFSKPTRCVYGYWKLKTQ